jgi:hypothetical protein
MISWAGSVSTGGGGAFGLPGEGDGPAYDGYGLVHVEGFRQVLEGAALVGVDGAVQVGVSGHDDDRQFRVSLVDALDEIHAVHARHAHVGDDGDRPLVVEVVQRVVGGGERRDGNAGLGHGPLQHPANRAVVVDHPDSVAHVRESSRSLRCRSLLNRQEDGKTGTSRSALALDDVRRADR